MVIDRLIKAIPASLIFYEKIDYLEKYCSIKKNYLVLNQYKPERNSMNFIKFLLITVFACQIGNINASASSSAAAAANAKVMHDPAHSVASLAAANAKVMHADKANIKTAASQDTTSPSSAAAIDTVNKEAQELKKLLEDEWVPTLTPYDSNCVWYTNDLLDNLSIYFYAELKDHNYLLSSYTPVHYLQKRCKLIEQKYTFYYKILDREFFWSFYQKNISSHQNHNPTNQNFHPARPYLTLKKLERMIKEEGFTASQLKNLKFRLTDAQRPLITISNSDIISKQPKAVSNSDMILKRQNEQSTVIFD